MVNITFSATNFIISLILTIFIILSIHFVQINKINDNISTLSKYSDQKNDNTKVASKPAIKNTQVTIERETTPPRIDLTPSQIAASNIAAIKEYDLNQFYNPFEEPARRVARHELPPEHFKRTIDIRSRGYPDNFTQYGVLKQVCEHGKKNNQNKILRLFGRQEYPGSNRYEYYTAINSGLDQIKVPLESKGKRELYDGDKVFVRELDEHYKVQLYNYDSPRYYPDIIW